MKNTIRCCISCILPCGALDVIRIVHSNGHVEELRGTVRAAEIMKLHPKHVLKKPSSPSYTDEGTVSCPRIIILPPDAELKRGKIYFLMPVSSSSSLPEQKTRSKSSSTQVKKKKNVIRDNSIPNNCENSHLLTNLVVSDRYLTEILSEKVKDRRRGRVGVWRPRLESISEATSDT